MLRKLLYASALILLLSIFLSPRLPFQDYPDWIYQAKVLKEIIQNNPESTQYFWVKSNFIPNSLTTTVLSLMSFLMPVDLAGRFFVAISLILLFLGIRGFLHAGIGNNQLSDVIGTVMAPSMFFFSGLLSFNLGIALFFIFFFVIKIPEGRISRILYYMIVLIILFYVHFLILFFVLSNLLFRVIFYRDKRVPSFVDSILCIIPVIVLSFLYLSGPSGDLQSQTSWHYSILFKINSFFKTFAIAYSFNDITPPLVEFLFIILNTLWIVFLFWLLVYLMGGNLRKAVGSDRLVYGASCILIGLVTPHWIRGMGNMDVRFYWLGAIFLLGAGFGLGRKLGPRIVKSALLAGALILIMKSGLIMFQGIAERNFEVGLKKAIPENTRFHPVMISLEFPEYHPEKSGIRGIISRMCAKTTPRVRTPIYLLMERNMVYSNIFRTGMLDTAPLKCDLKSLIENGIRKKDDNCGIFLFVSPSGFTDHFMKLLGDHFFTLSRGQGFILAEPALR